MNTKLLLFAGIGLLLLSGTTGCFYDVESELYPASDCSQTTSGFTAYVEPLVASQCAGCHGGASPDAGLALENYPQIRDAALSGQLENRINRTAGDPLLMPPNGPLSNCNIEAIQSWIADGAPEN